MLLDNQYSVEEVGQQGHLVITRNRSLKHATEMAFTWALSGRRGAVALERFLFPLFVQGDAVFEAVEKALSLLGLLLHLATDRLLELLELLHVFGMLG